MQPLSANEEIEASHKVLTGGPQLVSFRNGTASQIRLASNHRPLPFCLIWKHLDVSALATSHPILRELHRLTSCWRPPFICLTANLGCKEGLGQPRMTTEGQEQAQMELGPFSLLDP